MAFYNFAGSPLFGSLRPKAQEETPNSPKQELSEDMAPTTPTNKVPRYKSPSDRINQMAEAQRHPTALSVAEGKQFKALLDEAYRVAVRSYGSDSGRAFMTTLSPIVEDVTHRRKSLSEAKQVLAETTAKLTEIKQESFRNAVNVVSDRPDSYQNPYTPHSFYR